ncbi:MAG: helix-turn-helix domain-containing protein [Methanobacteriota archaeon]
MGFLDARVRVPARPLARRVGVSRSTFGEHLRKAYPYLKLRASRATARPEDPRP